MFKLEDICEATEGAILQKFEESFYGITTDSRAQSAQSFFIPLKGESFDGHRYLADAFQKGSRGALVQRGYEGVLPPNMTIIGVDDTLAALQDLAHYWRKKQAAKVIAITGSNGKTTTKFFLKHLLKGHKKTVCSEKSFNNHIGVPLTLLQIQEDTEICIVEVGSNHPGEIKALTELSQPDVAVVTTVGSSHLEGFGSIEGVAQEKLDLYRHSSSQGAQFVINADNEFTQSFSKDFPKAIKFSAKDSSASIYFKILKSSLEGMEIKACIQGAEETLTVPVLGPHNNFNLMAASALAISVGISSEEIFKSLKTCKTTWGRSELLKSTDNVYVFFDAYNANPDSMRALFQTASELETKGQKILVLGDMLELGEASEKLHEELGRAAGNLPMNEVFFVGTFASSFKAGLESSRLKNNSVITHTYKEELAKKLGSMLQPEDIVFIKGSRGGKLERFLESF